MSRTSAHGGTRRRRAPQSDTLVRNDPYHDPSVRVHTVEHVRYAEWPEWYTKVVTANGKVWHWGPWRTEWAARHCAHILARLFSLRDQLTGGVHA